MKKILCWFGWHAWTWKLQVTNNVAETLDVGKIPDQATCKHCHITYGTTEDIIKRSIEQVGRAVDRLAND